MRRIVAVIVLLLVLSGCIDPWEPIEGKTISESDSQFVELPDHLIQILKGAGIKKIETDPMKEVSNFDSDFVATEIINSKVIRTPEDVIKLDFALVIILHDDREIRLRILDDQVGIYSLYYQDIHYCLQNPSFVEWMMAYSSDAEG